MKKERSNFRFQDIYAQHYIPSNMRSQNDCSTHHTPGHNPYMGKTIRCYHKKHQQKNWMKIFKKYFIKFQKILILCQNHIPHNFDGTKLPDGGADKADNLNRKTNYSISKLQRNTPRRNNGIQKKRNNYPHLLGCILHIRTRGTKRSRRIFFPRTKIQHTDTGYSPG